MDSSSDSDEDINMEELLQQIQAQESLNKNLNEDLSELTRQCEVLEDYRNEMKHSLPGRRDDGVISISNTLSSFGSIQDRSNCLSSTQKDIQKCIIEAEFEDVFIPTESNKCFRSFQPCQGCGRMFGKHQYTYEGEYYIHCIKKCPRYRALNLIKKCNKCEKLFVNGKSLIAHTCDRYKPMYQGKQIALNKNGNVKMKNFKLVPCKGCGKKFKMHNYNNSSNRKYENDYYVHCITGCKKYQKRGLANVCLGCDKWFINKRAIAYHNCSIPVAERTSLVSKDERMFRGNIVTRPKWMLRRKFVNCAPLSSNSTKPKKCPGCKVWIEDAIIRKDQISFKYFVHCIDECDAYKKLNLIRECNICNSKYLNESCYEKHIRTHRK